MIRLEPEWWAEARKLEQQNFTHSQISQKLGYCRKSVRYALNQEARTKYIEDRKTDYRQGRASAFRYPRDRQRDDLRRYGRQIYKEKGGDLRKIYSELGCL